MERGGTDGGDLSLWSPVSPAIDGHTLVVLPDPGGYANSFFCT